MLYPFFHYFLQIQSMSEKQKSLDYNMLLLML